MFCATTSHIVLEMFIGHTIICLRYKTFLYSHMLFPDKKPVLSLLESVCLLLYHKRLDTYYIKWRKTNELFINFESRVSFCYKLIVTLNSSTQMLLSWIMLLTKLLFTSSIAAYPLITEVSTLPLPAKSVMRFLINFLLSV